MPSPNTNEHDKKRKEHAPDKRARKGYAEDEVTLNSEASFPASDPPSFNPGMTGVKDSNRTK